MHRRTLLPLAMLPWTALATATSPPAPADGDVVLTIGGKLPGRAAGAVWTATMARLASMPHTRYLARTPWYGQARPFAGPLLRHLLQAAGVKPVGDGQGQLLRALALNDYRVDIPLTDALRYDVIVARLLDDQPISLRDRGPLMLMYPFDSHPELRNAITYGRCAWQLHRLDML